MNLARDLLQEGLPRRWQHVQGVAARSRAFQGALAGDHPELLTAAAYVHDIGYADQVVDTGFHAVDGARYLRRLGADERLVGLVAHHTCAAIEADVRNFGSMFRSEFPRDGALPHDELLFCDLTTTPCGEATNVRDRLAEIRIRYEPNHVVHRFIDLAEDELLAASARAQEKLLLAPSDESPTCRPGKTATRHLVSAP